MGVTRFPNGISHAPVKGNPLALLGDPSLGLSAIDFIEDFLSDPIAEPLYGTGTTTAVNGFRNGERWRGFVFGTDYNSGANISTAIQPQLDQQAGVIRIRTGNRINQQSATLIGAAGQVVAGNGQPFYFSARIAISDPTETALACEIGLTIDEYPAAEETFQGESLYFQRDTANSQGLITFQAAPYAVAFHDNTGDNFFVCGINEDIGNTDPNGVAIGNEVAFQELDGIWSAESGVFYLFQIYHDGIDTYQFYIDGQLVATLQDDALQGQVLMPWFNVHGDTTATNRQLDIDYCIVSQPLDRMPS